LEYPEIWLWFSLQVKGIARGGGGTALFAAENEDLRGKVLSQLKNSLQPAITKVKVLWDGFEGPDVEAEDVEVVKEKTLLGYMKPKETKSKAFKYDLFCDIFAILFQRLIFLGLMDNLQRIFLQFMMEQDF